MKKSAVPFILFFTCLFVFSPRPTEAVYAPTLLEVTGYFQRYEILDEDSSRIYLKVEGQEEDAEGVLSPMCIYYNERGAIIKRDEFLRRYMKRMITVQIALMGEEGEIVQCRPGS